MKDPNIDEFRWNKIVLRQLRAFAMSNKGAMAVLFAIVLVPMTAISGAAIDLARAYAVKQKIGQAIDAAGLAAGASGGTEAEMRAIAQRYFDANYDAQDTGVLATMTISFEDETISLKAKASLDTTFLKVVGIDDVEVGAETEISQQQSGVEVVLVLDVTGSMFGTKLRSLKTAAKDFVDIIFGDEQRPEGAKIGIVPFAATVNIGPSQIAFTTQDNPNSFNADPAGWRGCVEARRPITDRDDTRDIFQGGNDRWPRYRFARVNGINNFPPVRGSRGQTSGPNKDCVVELLPLTNDKTKIVQKIDSLDARGLTHIAVGSVWGWRVVSPERPFTEGSAYDDPVFKKAVVIMTDGENTTLDPRFSPSNRYYTAYGNPVERRLGNSTNAIVAEQNARTLRVCSNMKDQGILVFTITFQVNSNSTRTLMQSCATSSANYFDSPSAADLRTSFETVAKQLSRLRISR